MKRAKKDRLWDGLGGSGNLVLAEQASARDPVFMGLLRRFARFTPKATPKISGQSKVGLGH